jgi:hypothetical protein
METLSIELSDEHIAQLNAMAANRGISVDEVVCELIGKWLDAYERDRHEEQLGGDYSGDHRPEAASDDRWPSGKKSVPQGDEGDMNKRSNNFVASFQIEGLCTALRILASSGVQYGNTAWELLRSLRNAFVESGTGVTVEHIPEVSDKSSPADLLIIAEVLRSTMLAFLTPEEVRENRGVFGFHNRVGDTD